jgi:hypothetical protein
MHVYDSVVAFERGAHLRKHAPRIGRKADAGAANTETPSIEVR